MNRKFYYFHIGRGGRFHNGNHKTFVSLVSENEITKHVWLMERDASGKFLFEYVNNVGRPIISKKDLEDGIKNGYVVLDFDTIYNTDIYMTVDKLDENDIELISNSKNGFDVEEALDLYFDYIK